MLKVANEVVGGEGRLLARADEIRAESEVDVRRTRRLPTGPDLEDWTASNEGGWGPIADDDGTTGLHWTVAEEIDEITLGIEPPATYRYDVDVLMEESEDGFLPMIGMTFAGGKPDRQRADDLLRDVGLGDRLDYLPGKLSVGQQQRVAVARALANRPKLLLADEPTGALDASTAQAVITLIKRLATEAGATLIVVTHDAAIAGALPRTLDLADINRAAVTAEVPA